MDVAAPDPVNAPRRDVAAASQVLREGREAARRRERRRLIGAWILIAALVGLSIPGLVVYFSGHG